ncbi:MAG: trehalase family glycosidase [Flavobacteriaceae bacterium]|nr:trehalase family glycosidase [Flavobacteriaceae bacterium]
MIFNLNIAQTLTLLLRQEDTNSDKKITIDDIGPKVFSITSISGQNYKVKGTYFLSNLLQELVLSKRNGNEFAQVPLERIEELPTVRISRLIKDYYWLGLTRTMDKKGIQKLLLDTKNNSLNSDKLRIYIPYKDVFAFKYYQHLENSLPIEAIALPQKITPKFVKGLNNYPGILALKLVSKNNEITGVPFVVPGGRFNEMYGWDSYFESIGLIIDGKKDLAKAMADNFQYEIDYYGKVLNANRSYYLTRTQPPFYTSLIQEVFKFTRDIDWLKSHLKTAIKEYQTVWMVAGKRLTQNGLNRYFAEGIGMPPECEKGHFDSIIKPYADKHNISLEDYILKYNSGDIENKELNTYFIHDRSVRESGHDTSYRIEGICADLNPVELNALLYKYEMDFGYLTETYLNNSFESFESSFWYSAANKRAKRMHKYMWNEDKKQYFDFNYITKEQSYFESASNYSPLWAGIVNLETAQTMLQTLMQELKVKGGVVGSSKRSRGEISALRPDRQWDYPNGWAPHQMMIWKGLLNYGFNKELQELIYRWLFMITKNAVDYNGTIPEKYNVVTGSHKVFSEYGNVGTDFEYITQEGFGWMNASYQYGLSLLQNNFRISLNNLTSPEKLFN